MLQQGEQQQDTQLPPVCAHVYCLRGCGEVRGRGTMVPAGWFLCQQSAWMRAADAQTSVVGCARLLWCGVLCSCTGARSSCFVIQTLVLGLINLVVHWPAAACISEVGCCWLASCTGTLAQLRCHVMPCSSHHKVQRKKKFSQSFAAHCAHHAVCCCGVLRSVALAYLLLVSWQTICATLDRLH
jgi:hypothetical protein